MQPELDPHSQSLCYKSLILEWKSHILNLHRNFSTAHSTSVTRTNFFIRSASERPQIHMKLYGFGECGLPPKKPGCYMSDIGDCFAFMNRLKQDLANSKSDQKQTGKDSQVCKLISEVLSPLKSSLKSQIQQLLIFIQQYRETEHFRAPKCALQFSLLDLLSKYHQKSITQLFFPNFMPSSHTCYSFYTASLEQNSQMLSNLKSHLSITKCLKIKYNSNIQKLIQLLTQIQKQGIGNWIIVDANCSWSLADFQNFFQEMNKQGLNKLKQKILYIEQPFDLYSYQKWQAVKSTSPFQILADQSFRNEQDIQKIKKVSHAVNIKTEKTGGAFATFMAAKKAKQNGLEVMFGSMCSTQLGCTQTFQFYPMAKFLDVDGALLTKQPSLEGGFTWKEDGKIQSYNEGYGLKVKGEKIFEQIEVQNKIKQSEEQ